MRMNDVMTERRVGRVCIYCGETKVIHQGDICKQCKRNRKPTPIRGYQRVCNRCGRGMNICVCSISKGISREELTYF